MCYLPKKSHLPWRIGLPSYRQFQDVLLKLYAYHQKSNSAGIIPSPQCIWFLNAYRIHCPKTSSGNPWKPMVFTFLSFLGLGPIFRCYCWLSPWNIISRENKDYLIVSILRSFGYWALLCPQKRRDYQRQWRFPVGSTMVRNGKREGATGYGNIDGDKVEMIRIEGTVTARKCVLPHVKHKRGQANRVEALLVIFLAVDSKQGDYRRVWIFDLTQKNGFLSGSM